MLPAPARLRRREDFRVVLRRGRRSGKSRLVVHALPDHPVEADHQPVSCCPRVGFVVSKAVGNAVVRHRVTRQLRHLLADRLDALPPCSTLVVRALPPAAAASSAELGVDLDGALRRLQLHQEVAR